MIDTLRPGDSVLYPHRAHAEARLYDEVVRLVVGKCRYLHFSGGGNQTGFNATQQE